MIIVKTFNDGFEISGHAFQDEPGKDLVCAAVSAISQGIINCFPKKKIDILEINKQEATIKFKLKNVDDRDKTILEVFKTQVLSIASDNKKYLKVIK